MTAPLRIGLAGGAASGKSTVAAEFARRGVAVISADAFAHALTRDDSPYLSEIRAAFGDDVFTPAGGLDRQALAKRVFADAAERERLQAILHPPIRRAIANAAADARGPYCLIEVPLLSAADKGTLVDRVLVVDASPEVQRARLAARPGMSAALAERILIAQDVREARLALADDVFVNDGPLGAVGPAVDALDALYADIAAKGDHGRPGLRLPAG